MSRQLIGFHHGEEYKFKFYGLNDPYSTMNAMAKIFPYAEYRGHAGKIVDRTGDRSHKKFNGWCRICNNAPAPICQVQQHGQLTKWTEDKLQGGQQDAAITCIRHLFRHLKRPEEVQQILYDAFIT